MDKRLVNFIGCSFILLLAVGLLAALLSYIYSIFSIDVYNRIVFALLIILIIAMVVILAAMVAVLATVITKRIHRGMLLPVKIGMKLVLPFALFAAGIAKKDKDGIRSLFIDINNLCVQSGNIRKSPDKVLILLPHCLQDSRCGLKITGDIKNCMNCGRCTIGTIRDMAEEKGVKAVVVTGGTAARSAIDREKPEIVLSVACERDLSIGILDVTSIPVVGVLNKRPNGPCENTTVDVGLLRDKLESILG
ncbi:MAG: DUF116 domain-containing protein [Bacillota bacterium]